MTDQRREGYNSTDMRDWNIPEPLNLDVGN